MKYKEILWEIIYNDYYDKVVNTNSQDSIEISPEHIDYIVEQIEDDIEIKTIAWIKQYIDKYLEKNEWFDLKDF